MNIKPIVTVMNFHSLLRVDASRKKAERYKLLESEINDLINVVVNNRNIILDKNTIEVNESAPEFGIYISSDFGFCGFINSAINKFALANSDDVKILIGAKLQKEIEGAVIKIRCEEFEDEITNIGEILNKVITEKKVSKIKLYYCHFYNTSKVDPVEKIIYPIKYDKSKQSKEDYVVEGDITSIMNNLISEYVKSLVCIAFSNSRASENIIRQNTTTVSLEKIEEIEIETAKEIAKEKIQKSFERSIDDHVKLKGNKSNG